MAQDKIRWGILSTALIGTEKVIPAMQQGKFCEVVAISSRDSAKAKAAAEKLGIATSHGSYDELLADPNVDAVYNPLPNHMHVPWSIKALEAGKHVLCEKPIGLSSAEGQELVDAGKKHPQLKLMEAFMYRHHPQWVTMRDMINAGEIGEFRTINSFFSYFNNDPNNIRNMADIGGGALMDIGCYPISLSRFLFGAEPTGIQSAVEYDPELKIDRLSSVIMQFEKGTSTFTCSTQMHPYQRVHAYGTRGHLEIEIPFNAPPGVQCRLWHHRSDPGEFVSDADGRKEILVEACDQYTIQGDLFARAILDDTVVPTPIEDAVANMKVIEQIKALSK